jgi:ribosomal protein S27E
MPIETTCPGCQRRLRAPDHAAGRQIRCPNCGQTLAVPEAGAKGGAAKAGPAHKDAAAARPRPPIPAKGQTPNPATAKKGTPSASPKPVATPKPSPPARRVPAAPAPSVAPRKAEPKPAPAVETWHVKSDEGETFGPIPKSELDQWVAENRVTAEFQLLKAGADQWQWAGDVYPQLAQAGPPAAESGAIAIATDSSPTARLKGGTSTTKVGRGKRSPPTGVVTAIAVVNFILGGLQLLGGIIVFAMGGLIAAALQSGPPAGTVDPAKLAEVTAAMQTFVLVGGAIALVAALTMFLAGFGVLMRASWGRFLTIGLAILMLPGAPGVLPLAYSIFVFVVLFNRKYAAEFA